MGTLKISDLSVGDWVEYEGLHYPITFVGYGEGGDGCLVNLIRPDLSCFTCKISDIRPIPITAEILEKNGWEKEGGSYRWSNEKYRVFIWLKKFSHFVDVIEMDMQFATKNSCIEVSQLYVHLLQHVLRLAGVDKEINL